MKIKPFILRLLARLIAIMGIRFSNGGTHERIGHLVAEQLYMQLLMRESKRNGVFFVVVIPKGKAANEYLITLFPRNFVFIRSSKLIDLLKPLLNIKKIIIDMDEGVASVSKAVNIFKYTHLIDSKKPFLVIPRKDSESLFELKNKCGIGKYDWYVCLHNRSIGYSVRDDDIHEYRNSSIESYFDAIKFIIDRGGKVIRVGDGDKDKSENEVLQMAGFFDYSNSEFKNSKNDILILSESKFFIGNSSGIWTFCAANGKPIVATNMAPLGATKAFGPYDIAIPKLYKDIKGNLIKFKTIFENGSANYRYSELFRDQSISLVDNTSDEILMATMEMYNSVINFSGKNCIPTNLQKDFNSLFDSTNYTFFSPTLISNYFLLKHRSLI